MPHLSLHILVTVLVVVAHHFSGVTVNVSAFAPPPLYKYASTDSLRLHNSKGPYEDLPSTYPDGIPAGMRAEAITSALKSGRCIGWNLQSPPNRLSSGGMLEIKGKGMKDFLNNKLTQQFDSFSGERSYFDEACLLTPKGRVVDRLKVARTDDQTAYLLTSPGYSAQTLSNQLDPFIFPLDQIELSLYKKATVFTLASTQWLHVQDVIRRQVLKDEPSSTVNNAKLPMSTSQSTLLQLEDGIKLLIMPSTGLPQQLCVGYTLVFFSENTNDSSTRGQAIWDFLTSEENADGPIALGAREYENLRILAGQSAFGRELAQDVSPLELAWDATVSLEKGCYLGQEGVASIVKNPRGPPRTIYQVVFDDDENVYNNEGSSADNLTRYPKVGDKLFVLGSNGEIQAGTITSTAEPGGTGEACTVGLALIRRADSILKQMKKLDLEPYQPPVNMLDEIESSSAPDASGMIEPPPLDPLDGLEVIIGDSFTIGRLRMVPSRRYRPGTSLLDPMIEVDELPEEGKEMAVKIQSEETSAAETQEETTTSVEEAEAAAAEAKRKAEKMEMLKKRAEEAMARRKAAAAAKKN